MANQNFSKGPNVSEDEKFNEKKVPKDNLNKFAALSYNPAGFLPSAAIFRVTLSQLKPAVLDFAKTFLSDIQNVTFITNPKSGEISTFVWLPADSKHLRDTSTMDERSAVKLPIIRYSPDLKTFMDRFCHSDHRRTISEENGLNLAGIQIDLARIAKLIFDENGVKFSNDCGVQRTPANIRLTANFEKGDGVNFGRLRYLEVVKSTRTGLEEVEPKPKKSFKAV